ncbi:MAG: hypothetical protein QF464_18115, partial [Myxococcota bacterium]|nr:hypothetical protein [Myxococcota bacterium]
MTVRIHHLCALVAALAVVTTTTFARAESDPATMVKPLVVFLLDTSGSMEYESGNATNAAS